MAGRVKAGFTTETKKIRVVELSKGVGRKKVKGKEYRYEYMTLNLNVYINKYIVEKYGTKYVVAFDKEKGVLKAAPLPVAKEELGLTDEEYSKVLSMASEEEA